MIQLANIFKAFLAGIAHSKVSLLGATLTTVTFPILLLSIILDMQGVVHNPYFGFVVYMVLGPMFITGLILVFIGVFFFKGRQELGVFTYEYLREQFTAPDKFIRIRKIIMLVTGLTMLNIFIVLLISYTGYHYTESVAFCGQFCHTVMAPEYTAYQNSPHSRVKCVECHIGSGAQWFAKSKLSGARQLVAVALNTYSRPIETPVHGLRPARETCEQCHRPELFHGEKLYVKDKYLPDEKNTHVQTVLLMKVGHGGFRGQQAHGIHWHVAPENTITYTHADAGRQQITEVVLEKKNGTKVVFSVDGETPAPQNQGGHEGGVRIMDCIDCHNRPTHIYLTADEALDQKILTGKIPSDLPFVKRQALEVVNQEYNSTAEARNAIATQLRAWYQENYPALFKNKIITIEKAIGGVQQAYEENVFPSMKIGWNTYPNFLGHRNDSGCFRCHDDGHSTKAGETISMDCETCHIILAEDEPAPEILKTLRGSL